MLIRIIITYLAAHKRLVVPQLGAFLVKEPGREVVFSELIRRDDGVLRRLLEAEGMTSLAAAGEIDRLVFEVRHAVEEGRVYALHGLGNFRAGANGTIAFEYLPASASVVAEPTESVAEPRQAAPTVVVQPPTKPLVAEDAPSEEQKPKIEEQHHARHRDEVEDEELHLSVSAKMNPASYVKGLKYGKPPKNTNAFTYVDKPQRRGTDRFIWFALLAIALALGAIAFGFYHEWQEEQYVEKEPALVVAPADSLMNEQLQ